MFQRGIYQHILGVVGAFLPVACLWVLKLPKGMCMSAFLAALDQTIVGTALPTIATELHGYDSYSWVATAYVLTSTAFQPLYGRFSDLLGRKVLAFLTHHSSPINHHHHSALQHRRITFTYRLFVRLSYCLDYSCLRLGHCYVRSQQILIC